MRFYCRSNEKSSPIPDSRERWALPAPNRYALNLRFIGKNARGRGRKNFWRVNSVHFRNAKHALLVNKGTKARMNVGSEHERKT
jgi:hypothetical protein